MAMEMADEETEVNITMFGPGIKGGVINEIIPFRFDIVCKGEHGGKIHVPAEAIEVDIVGPDDEEVEASIELVKLSQFKVLYTPDSPGDYNVMVRIFGKDILPEPIMVTFGEGDNYGKDKSNGKSNKRSVSESQSSSNNDNGENSGEDSGEEDDGPKLQCVVDGDGARGGNVRFPLSFSFTIKDENGKPMKANADDIKIEINGPDKTKINPKLTPTTLPGEFDVAYRVPKPGNYKIEIFYKNKAILNPPITSVCAEEKVEQEPVRFAKAPIKASNPNLNNKSPVVVKSAPKTVTPVSKPATPAKPVSSVGGNISVEVEELRRKKQKKLWGLNEIKKHLDETQQQLEKLRAREADLLAKKEAKEAKLDDILSQLGEKKEIKSTAEERAKEVAKKREEDAKKKFKEGVIEEQQRKENEKRAEEDRKMEELRQVAQHKRMREKDSLTLDDKGKKTSERRERPKPKRSHSAKSTGSQIKKSSSSKSTNKIDSVSSSEIKEVPKSSSSTKKSGTSSSKKTKK